MGELWRVMLRCESLSRRQSFFINHEGHESGIVFLSFVSFVVRNLIA